MVNLLHHGKAIPQQLELSGRVPQKGLLVVKVLFPVPIPQFSNPISVYCWFGVSIFW